MALNFSHDAPSTKGRGVERGLAPYLKADYGHANIEQVGEEEGWNVHRLCAAGRVVLNSVGDVQAQQLFQLPLSS
ncbi:hypothetical protein RRG08_035398 [Elysia crispata]|uniref:Uncharacterized protein n=1 Tax=Elysia crispata TaxID=231223 RepID=A0AAE0Y3N9_9GAST|nr:hypothetical protein RRG08_035398 [Elysia crispata]